MKPISYDITTAFHSVHNTQTSTRTHSATPRAACCSPPILPRYDKGLSSRATTRQKRGRDVGFSYHLDTCHRCIIPFRGFGVFLFEPQLHYHISDRFSNQRIASNLYNPVFIPSSTSSFPADARSPFSPTYTSIISTKELPSSIAWQTPFPFT